METLVPKKYKYLGKVGKRTHKSPVLSNPSSIPYFLRSHVL